MKPCSPPDDHEDRRRSSTGSGTTSPAPAAELLTPAYSSFMSDEDESGALLLNPRVAAAVVDVFVYVVVLNLFVEYFPKVLVESFILSLLTAVLLKVVLEVVLMIERPLKTRFRQAETGVGKAITGLLLWLVLVGSKFLILELVD